MTIIDCNTCPARGQHCSSCFVPIVAGAWLRDEASYPEEARTSTSVGPGPGHPPSTLPSSGSSSMPLTDAEWDAVDTFIGAGLVNTLDVLELVATPDTSAQPGWLRVS
ncbi:MAG: hypothetical protein WBG89_14305 [Ornithinimicrobium sp.]